MCYGLKNNNTKFNTSNNNRLIVVRGGDVC